MMKIALIGNGKMGQLIEQTAQAHNHEIIAIFSKTKGKLQERQAELAGADLVIDFSHPTAVVENVACCLAYGKPLVIGTTGWEAELTAVQNKVMESGGSCLYAPNFSVGAYLFQRLMAYAAALFQPFEEYDACGVEYHHRQKIDQPSGTAKALSSKMLENLPRLQSFDFMSVRCGKMVGTHTIHFESGVDSLQFTHEAKNRLGFAEGALLAAEWLINRKGFFTLDEMMEEKVSGRYL